MSDKYLVFAGLQFYAAGGWRDYFGAYDTLDLAKAEVLRIKTDGENIEDPAFVDSEEDLDLKKIDGNLVLSG